MNWELFYLICFVVGFAFSICPSIFILAATGSGMYMGPAMFTGREVGLRVLIFHFSIR
jgi:hypothetical protein